MSMLPQVVSEMMQVLLNIYFPSPKNRIRSVLIEKLFLQTAVSVTRINKFLNAEELDPDIISHDRRSKYLIPSNGVKSSSKKYSLKIFF